VVPGLTFVPLAGAERVLTDDALAFVADLQRRFDPTRRALLGEREVRQRAFDGGALPDFLGETQAIREGAWSVGPAPKDLDDRRVEITGPVERKMVINALNSGAKVFMADFEDSLSPTWPNVALGQVNLCDAVRRTIRLVDEAKGKTYELAATTATLVVRPRGWHLEERHITIDGAPASASLVDFGLYFFHNAKELLARGSGPYFYLPKMEGHREARLWNDVFVHAQQALGIPRGTIRATVLIETILGAFEMEEILFELKEHAAGLNAGRWDYIFSMIKKLRSRSDSVLPDRASVSMTVPFMKAYAEKLVQVCHRRGAHAMGGMAAFVPSRKDPEVNARAFAKVKEDKTREAAQGYDGTWVAHPDLVKVAQEAFDRVLGERPNQKQVKREDVRTSARDLLDVRAGGPPVVTLEGVRLNVDVALQYLDAWLGGEGAVAIYNLMEDAATAEISRAQLWQWIRHAAVTKDGPRVDAALYEKVRQGEQARLEQANGPRRYGDAAALLDALVLSPRFETFLTIPAYARLD
jgi:malate synthase